jgi:hypothetical protein
MTKLRRLQKNGLRSEFADCEITETWRANGEPLAAGESPPPMRLQCETVYRGRKVIAIYIVANGERVAYRGRQGGMPAGVSMKDGVGFHNGIDAPGSDAVQ